MIPYVVNIVSLTLIKLNENDLVTLNLSLYSTSMYFMSTCRLSLWPYKHQASQQPIVSLSGGTGY
jgi:hypothetical protein